MFIELYIYMIYSLRKPDPFDHHTAFYRIEGFKGRGGGSLKRGASLSDSGCVIFSSQRSTASNGLEKKLEKIYFSCPIG